MHTYTTNLLESRCEEEAQTQKRKLHSMARSQMSGPGKKFCGVVMGTRELQKCGAVSKGVSEVNGWYRLALFSESQHKICV